jgi:hypothetical protein
MSATPAQQALLDTCDELALLTGIDQELQAVATRITNRAKTLNEADDVKLLIACRGELARLKSYIASHHPDGRQGV